MNLKIGHFGVYLAEAISPRTKKYSYRYLAPEMASKQDKSFSKEADVWSLGCIVY